MLYLILSFVVAIVFMFYPTFVALVVQKSYRTIGIIMVLNITLALVSMLVVVSSLAWIDIITLWLFVFSYLMIVEDKPIDL